MIHTRLFATALALGAACLFAAAAPVRAITLKEEVELGERIDQEILKQTPLIDDQQALTQIDEYGQKLVQNVRRPEIKYHFRIIKDDDLNAFAVPGGYVYFSSHLWSVLRKDERIGVLAHEIVHVDRRHALDALSKARRRQIWLAVLLTAVKANQTWGDVADVLHSIYTLKYTRADEQQADEVGVQLTRQAGYNPAGLLLAMRKISRFQSEAGGEPPKIFSSHPPTPERLKYLSSLLTNMGVSIPPDSPVHEQNPYRIGDVIAVEDNRIRFVSSKSLSVGQVVWLMTPGWDYYYEKRSAVPAARAIIMNKSQSTYFADITLLPGTKITEIAKDTGVYDPPKPKPLQGIARLDPAMSSGRTPIAASAPLKKLERLMAKDIVWNKDRTELVYADTAYLVVTDPSSRTGYIASGNPAYSYVSLASGAELFRIKDSYADRWVGPVASIGRRGETIEILTDRQKERLTADLTSGKRFDLLCPSWDPKDSYQDRLVGKAVLKSINGKIVLQMVSYLPGWDINSVGVGFDLYEPKSK